jgi:hypothetical protein
MFYMIVETFHAGKVSELYKRFEEKGRMLPQGVRYVSSWIDDRFTRCFQVMECDDPKLLREWVVHWNDLADFEIIPVLTSDQARERVLDGPAR